jgi:hypothetical protein
MQKDGTQTGVRSTCVRAAVFVFLISLFFSDTAFSQSIWAEAGTSTMFRASGFDVNYRWAPVQGFVSAGWSDGFHVGGLLQTRVKGVNVGVGDWYQSLALDTDVFDQSRYFSGRGVAVQKSGESRSIVFFAGTTADENSSLFYKTYESRDPVGGVFYEQKLSNTLSFHSMNLVEEKLTSIQSLHYQVKENWDVSAATGLGNGSGYFSLATRLQHLHWQLTSSYSTLGDSFQRISGIVNNAPERVGFNAHFQYQPSRTLQFGLAHDNLISPTLSTAQKSQNVSLDSANTSWSVKGFRLGAAATYSKAGDLTATTENVGVSRKVTSNIMTSGSYLRIQNNTQTTNILIGNVQEKITAHLTLNQGVSLQYNNRSLTWGAHWLGNRFTVGVQQDVLYTPLAGGFGSNPYISVWSVNLMTQLPRSMRLHLDSIIDPSGHVRYTSWIDGIGYSRNGDGPPNRVAPASASFGRFVVMGQVQDEQGRPVWGIAIQVDGETAFTDNTGHFFLRFRKGLTYPVAVLSNRSLNPQYYEAVQVPVSALAETEDMARPILIVVRRANAPVKRSETAEPDSSSVATALSSLNQ